MRILAYDTSGETLTAALAVDGALVCERESAPLARHSAALVPLLDELLRKARWKPGDLDVLAVGVGPGSFTGLRVGVATAKMLGLVWGTKLVGVSSLEAIAASVEGGKIAVALDARRGKIYGALFERKGQQTRTRIAPTLTTTREFFDRLPTSAFVVEDPGIVRASAVARVAYEKARRGCFTAPERLEPLYLHPKDCNVTIKK